MAIRGQGERWRGLGTAGARLVVALACALTLGSCINENITASRSSSILVIERIGAASGGTNDDPIPTFLESDVLTNGSVFARISDLAVVPYGQDKSARRDFRGSDARNPPRRVTPCG